MAGGAAGSSLEVTPTWATASICGIIVVVSIAAQRGIHWTGRWLHGRTDNIPLKNALEKLKEELMLLGVISLLLAVSQTFTSEICVPRSLIQTMLPCKNRRFLAAGSDSNCLKKGKAPILSATDIHDLHMFIFMLAVVHVSYSLLTVYLGGRKIQAWKEWEQKAQTESVSNNSPDVNTSYLVRETKFIRRHIRSSSTTIGLLVSFLQQFGRSVTKDDYETLRHTFIQEHSLENNFEFHEYVRKSTADDLKTVIGVSEYFWVYVIVFFLLNVHGWYTYMWIAVIPIASLLLLGAKLQYILGTLADDILHRAAEGGKAPTLDHKVFWFGSPRLLLHLLHFTIFQNAFELSLFFWVLATFGWDSCLMDNKFTSIFHIVSGVLILVQCGYTTLPLYALLAQMGELRKEKTGSAQTDKQEEEEETTQTDRQETNQDIENLHSQI